MATATQTQITRLTNAKSSLKTAIQDKGVTVPSTTKLDGYAALVTKISPGASRDSTNLLENCSPTGRTHKGVTYTRNANHSWTVSGTATAASFVNIFTTEGQSPMSLPSWLTAGTTYKVKYAGNKVRFRIYPWSNGRMGSAICDTLTDTTVTIPSTATGITIRIFTVSGSTATETVYPALTK